MPFDHLEFDCHESVSFHNDEPSGLRAIVALHSTHLGPALGGVRMMNYRSEQEAITDVLRLSRGMSLKAAAAGVSYGGAKSVIIGDPRTARTSDLLEAMGSVVESYGGRYIAGEDVNIGVPEVGVMRRRTQNVLGSAELGGDPSPFTARGVFSALRAAVKHRLGRSDLEGLRVAVQGVGKVGATLVECLVAAGATPILADADHARVSELAGRLGLDVVEPERIHAVEADVFSPNALGASINAKTVPELKATVVVGGANNQLATPQDGRGLADRGICYVPDYLANAGGLLNIVAEYEAGRGMRPYDGGQVEASLETIGDRTAELLTRAKSIGEQPDLTCDRMAYERIRRMERAA
ncbi:MAG: Glu/Leu/Phe/Val dehydrogenase dimerization domain-containing protein [Thalassobaculaceae bacterium]|nr:Glu/Leu/Phe/Val dehydrogenase dimerization domain-containing protein [Thalassobaculaceae bacterium]